MMYLTTPQVAGLVMSITSIACLFIMVSGYYMIKLMTPQRVAVSVTMPTAQSVRPDISRLRQLTRTLPTTTPKDIYTRTLIDALATTLQKASAYATIMDDDPERGREGLDRAIRQFRATLRNLT
jgi:hypothetical protein